MPNIIIDLAAEFTGAKAFDKAGKSTINLEKSVKSLGKTFARTFGTAAVLAYSRASVKAAAADQKAQQQLALALKNVGLGRDAATAEGYIQRIEKELGIVDDKLRPAYAKLAISTRDYNETQRLMGIAMDISANTGKDLEAVSQALAKAYLGNNASLSKLNVGISKADLSTKSFQEITDQLAVTFAGAAKASADSYAGSIDKLSIASNNAKEVIGTSLINALAAFSGKEGAGGAVTTIDKLAKGISSTVTGVTYLVKEINIAKPILVGAGVAIMLAWAPWFTAITAAVALVGYIGNALKKNAGFQGMGNVAMTGGSNMDTQKFEAEQKKIAAAKIAAEKKALAAKIAADKKAAANATKLAKAKSIFDLDRIQIEAALKGKISEEEKIRLLLLQAIADEDADKAETLSKKLEEIQKKNEAIAKSLLAIGQAKDPFSTWAGSLTAALLELNKVGEKMFAIRQKESGYVDTSILSGNTFPQDATPEQIVAIVEEAVKVAETAAIQAAESVAQTQTATEALAKSADAAVAIAETLGVIDTANVLGVAADIANQAQSSSIFKPGPNLLPTLIDQVSALVSGGSNAGAGTSSSMFNPYATTPGSSAGFGIQNPVSIIVNNNGSVIMQDDFVDAVNNAILAADRAGYGRTPAGFIPA